LNASPRSPAAGFRIRVTILVLVLLGVALTAVVRSVLVSFHSTCAVCVTFRGRTVCREAVGRDRESALRTARRHACGYLADGEADLAACLAAPSDSETCEGD
jgi:hypothetical protein